MSRRSSIAAFSINDFHDYLDRRMGGPAMVTRRVLREGDMPVALKDSMKKLEEARAKPGIAPAHKKRLGNAIKFFISNWPSFTSETRQSILLTYVRLTLDGQDREVPRLVGNPHTLATQQIEQPMPQFRTTIKLRYPDELAYEMDISHCKTLKDLRKALRTAEVEPRMIGRHQECQLYTEEVDTSESRLTPRGTILKHVANEEAFTLARVANAPLSIVVWRAEKPFHLLLIGCFDSHRDHHHPFEKRETLEKTRKKLNALRAKLEKEKATYFYKLATKSKVSVTAEREEWLEHCTTPFACEVCAVDQERQTA